MDTDNLLSVRQAAELKGCSRQSIYNALERGDLNGTTAGGFRLVIRDDAFDGWEVQDKFRPLTHRSDESPNR